MTLNPIIIKVTNSNIITPIRSISNIGPQESEIYSGKTGKADNTNTNDNGNDSTNYHFFIWN